MTGAWTGIISLAICRFSEVLRNRRKKANGMGEIATAALTFTAVGVLFICLGIPLFLGRVRPNWWYGCRTKKTLSDVKVWYAVNRVTGRDSDNRDERSRRAGNCGALILATA